MSKLQLIESALKRAARRRRLERAWRGLWQGLLIGGAVWLAVLGAFKLFPIPAWSLWAAAALGGALVFASVIAAAARKISILDTARWVDDQKHFQERLSTALEVSALPAPADWKQLLMSDAARHAQNLDPRLLLPLNFPTVSR